ncbi:unnamed protein product [Parajaminaea phylloscopi]
MVKSSDILLILVAILFPPAAAAFVAGCGCDLLINILLTILGYLPGHLHAFWVSCAPRLIYRKMKAEERYGYNGFVYIGNGKYEAAPGADIRDHPPSYGATNL